MIVGVDIHPKYQEGFDFDEAFDEGVRFAWIKTSEGDSFVPGGLARLVKSARDGRSSRIIDGYYHFLTDTAPGWKQADHFVATLVAVLGDLSGIMVAVDYEASGGTTAGDAQLKSFIKRLRTYLPNRPIVVYSGWAFWTGNAPGTSRSGPLSAFGDNLVPWDARVAYAEERRNDPVAWHDEILAWYERQPTWGGWDTDKRRRFWQFTWGGRFAGMYVDCDAFYGTYEGLQRLAGMGDGPVVKPDPQKPGSVTTPLEQDVEDVIAFGMDMLGTPYGTGWRAGTWPPLSPLYAHITKHDEPSWYRQRPCICSGFENVLRFEVVELPAIGARQGDGWPGGMAAIGRHLMFAPGSQPYPPVKNTPRGWTVNSPYLGAALAIQGHTGVALGNGLVLEARIPALSANRTESEGAKALVRWGGRPYTRIVPPSVWLRK